MTRNGWVVIGWEMYGRREREEGRRVVRVFYSVSKKGVGGGTESDSSYGGLKDKGDRNQLRQWGTPMVSRNPC